MNDAPRLSVVIPCYNELANLENGCLAEVEEYLADVDFTWEVVIANDGSTDGSGEFVHEWCSERDGWHAIDVDHGGKPVAVWGGIQAAVGELVLFTDMDQSTPLREWERLRPWFDRGFEVVIGSRGGEREGFNILRQVGSVVFRGIRRAMLLAEIDDTQCGFKACTRQAALQCFPKLQFFQSDREAKGWRVSAYDVELLYLFQTAGYRIKEIDVEWSDRDVSVTKGSTSGLRQYVRESKNMFEEVVRVKRNASQGLYDES